MPVPDSMATIPVSLQTGPSKPATAARYLPVAELLPPNASPVKKPWFIVGSWLWLLVGSIGLEVVKLGLLTVK